MKWISVEERLPEEDQDILVICDNRDLVVFYGFFQDGEFSYLNNGFYYTPKKGQRTAIVTHWIPKPKLESEDEQG